MTNDMSISQWHVPIDDKHSWWYAIFTAFDDEIDKEAMRNQRLELYSLPDYRPRTNKTNNYGYDPEEQRTTTFTGMGMDINVHDQWAVESPGHIYDRSREHLGAADKGIITFRRSLIKAINGLIEGKPAPFLLQGEAGSKLRGPVAIDTTADIHSWNDDWKSQDKNKREHSTWAKGFGT